MQKIGTYLNGLVELGVAYLADDSVAGHHIMAGLLTRGLGFRRSGRSWSAIWRGRGSRGTVESGVGQYRHFKETTFVSRVVSVLPTTSRIPDGGAAVSGGIVLKEGKEDWQDSSRAGCRDG